MIELPYYERDVDFENLSKRDEQFAAILQEGKRKRFIDFQDTRIVQQLTKSLLRADFQLALDLPDDRLCPPVPVRWNYVRWVQDLLDTTSDGYRDVADPERAVIGLDVGVGASCIYPLLACSTRESWRMAGTDVDAHSLEWARQNVERNGLSECIRLKQVSDNAPLIPLDSMGIREIDFVMTNPPFYSSQQDFESAAKLDASSSSSSSPSAGYAVCHGSTNEMICPGGDVGFVMRIFHESLKLRERIQWYTAMLSKLSSLQRIVATLRDHEINNYAVTSLRPGHKTRRWAVGWSFSDYRPRNDISRHGDLISSVLPPPTTQTIKVPMQTAKWSGRKVDETMKGLEVRWEWKASLDTGLMECERNVWSRAARRKKQFEMPETGVKRMTIEEDVATEKIDHPVALAVKIICRDEEVEVRWLRGKERVVFEAFCGMLKRALVSS